MPCVHQEPKKYVCTSEGCQPCNGCGGHTCSGSLSGCGPGCSAAGACSSASSPHSARTRCRSSPPGVSPWGGGGQRRPTNVRTHGPDSDATGSAALSRCLILSGGWCQRSRPKECAAAPRITKMKKKCVPGRQRGTPTLLDGSFLLYRPRETDLGAPHAGTGSPSAPPAAALPLVRDMALLQGDVGGAGRVRIDTPCNVTAPG